jgi:hypothetical protein
MRGDASLEQILDWAASTAAGKAAGKAARRLTQLPRPFVLARRPLYADEYGHNSGGGIRALTVDITNTGYRPAHLTQVSSFNIFFRVSSPRKTKTWNAGDEFVRDAAGGAIEAKSKEVKREMRLV